MNRSELKTGLEVVYAERKDLPSYYVSGTRAKIVEVLPGTGNKYRARWNYHSNVEGIAKLVGLEEAESRHINPRGTGLLVRVEFTNEKTGETYPGVVRSGYLHDVRFDEYAERVEERRAAREDMRAEEDRKAKKAEALRKRVGGLTGVEYGLGYGKKVELEAHVFYALLDALGARDEFDGGRDD